MRRRRYLATITALAGTTLAGCTDGGGGRQMQTTTTETEGSTTTATEGSTTTATEGSNASVGATVEMVDVSFDPVTASIDPGSAIEWKNADGFEHDVTATQFQDGAASWDFSTTLASGETATHAFDSAGVYEYYCTIHGEGEMCGAVVVGDASMDWTLPCQDGGGTKTGGDGDGGDDDGGYY